MTHINPKPTTVVELFTGHPERWNQDGGAFKNNMMEPPCCIFGSIQIVYGHYTTDSCRAVTDRVRLAMPDQNISALFVWNDAPKRTFEEVLAKCVELGI